MFTGIIEAFAKVYNIEKEEQLRILRKEKRDQYLINKELFLKNSIKRNAGVI